MKNILVLTDFSQNPKTAEKYALQLAIQVKAHLILYYAYPHHAKSSSENVVWLHDQHASLELQSISNLQSTVDELNDEITKVKNDIYKPAISHLGMLDIINKIK